MSLHKRLMAGAMLAVLCNPALAARLFDGVPVGGKVTVAGLEIDGAKALPRNLTLEHIDVYAPGARIFVTHDKGGFTEAPRSAQRFFVTDPKHSFVRLWIAVSPDGRAFTGSWFDAGGTRRFHGDVGKSGLTVHAGSELENAGGFECGNDLQPLRDPNATPAANPLAGLVLPKGVVTHQAIVAVDTDNEFMSLKFANSVPNATAYVAQLFAGLNVFYERDLQVRLVQGTTFLRTTPDPYSQTTLVPQLNEFATVWKDTPALQAVDRAFATLLSGKSTNQFSAGGYASQLDNHNYCAEKGTNFGNLVFGHYSVIQVFRFAQATASSDVGIVGHELGHNFGAAHTHCTNRITGTDPSSTTTIDQCYAGDAGIGCYAGPVSCPNDNSVPGQGSLMSYCNFSAISGGAACAPNGGQVLREFHPTHQVVLGVRVAANIANQCFDPIVLQPPNRIFAHGFEN